MIWLIIWLIFALAVIGYASWSLVEVLKQKRAWQAFAKKYNMEYLEEGFFSPPGFWGILQDKKVMAYVSVIAGNDKEKAGSWTFIDVVFQSNFEERYLIVGAKPLFKELVGDTSALDIFTPNDLGWSGKTPFYTNDPEFFRSFLNKDKIQAVEALKKLGDGGYQMIIQPELSSVSYYTRQPLSSPKRINDIVKALLDCAARWDSSNDITRVVSASMDTSALSFEDDFENKDKEQISSLSKQEENKDA